MGEKAMKKVRALGRVDALECDDKAAMEDDNCNNAVHGGERD